MKRKETNYTKLIDELKEVYLSDNYIQTELSNLKTEVDEMINNLSNNKAFYYKLK